MSINIKAGFHFPQDRNGQESFLCVRAVSPVRELTRQRKLPCPFPSWGKLSWVIMMIMMNRTLMIFCEMTDGNKLIDSSFLLRQQRRRSAHTRAAEPPAFLLLPAFFCFQFYLSVSLLSLLTKAIIVSCVSQPPFPLREHSTSFLFETSICEVWNYSPVGTGNTLPSSSLNPPPPG